MVKQNGDLKRRSQAVISSGELNLGRFGYGTAPITGA